MLVQDFYSMKTLPTVGIETSGQLRRNLIDHSFQVLGSIKHVLFTVFKKRIKVFNVKNLCVAAHRRMRTVTNYFLVNLSVSDLLMSLLNCMFNFIFMINSDWPFGAVYCTVNNFVANVTVAASVFTLVAISLDR